MKGDFTRSTFRPDKHYSGVRMQQGRVQMDADWNEEVDILNYLDRTTRRDVIGVSGIPALRGGFAIAPNATGTDLTISDGRIYVDGILAENEATIDFAVQPDLPGAQPISNPGTYLIYLDVWQQHITALEDSQIREVALGGADTTTRTKTVWQAQMRWLGDEHASIQCSTLPDWQPMIYPTKGKLDAQAEPQPKASSNCIVEPGAGYRRLENQLYRVEIQQGTDAGAPTFIWSRDNGSIVKAWKSKNGDDLIVTELGRDKMLGFAPGQWIELTDDSHELLHRSGTLVRVLKAEGQVITINPATATGSVDIADFPRNPKIRRWDMLATGPVALTGGAWIDLEDGVQVQFDMSGNYNVGDYWLIPARSAASVEWPFTAPQPPHGIEHHFCALAIVRKFPNQPLMASDIENCRELFPSLTNISAADVSYSRDVCDLGASTVQGALEQLCQRQDLRFHNKHLHGWGIVHGLQVVCGPDGQGQRRSNVIVKPGYAIDFEGNDILQEEDTPIDLLTDASDLITAGEQVDICITLHSDGSYGYEKHDPKKDNDLRALFAGTLLMDFYNDCIRSVQDFLEKELTPPVGEEDLPAGPVQQRVSALTNILAQWFNPQTGQGIFLSLREHEILEVFYNGLRAILQSETFCAMFDDAQPFPTYPFANLGMDTIFAKSNHTRLRRRPGGKEAYTVGRGLNPLKPSTLIYRFDLEKRLLISQIDPVTQEEGEQTTSDSGAGTVEDVAFSLDGSQIYVIIPTQNLKNTLFRVGTITDDSINWGPLFTICGVHLVTLATTAADPEAVYAIGVRHEDESSEEPGLYRIELDRQDANLRPLHPFEAIGHLRITTDGRAFATAMVEDVSDAPESPKSVHVEVVSLQLQGAQPPIHINDINLGATACDDIALFTADDGADVETLYSVVGEGNSPRTLLAYHINSGVQLAQLPLEDSTIHLEPYAPASMLLYTVEDDYCLKLIDMKTNQPVQDYLLPMQVGPIAVMADPETKVTYVLNQISDTISLVPGELLDPDFRFPFQELVDYRTGVLQAFTDLLAGFLQYLKDCLCDHFLVKAPRYDPADKIYLACVTIRNDQVYKVCNFSKRRYVKSFPTIEYWLSLVPILPLIDRAIQEFCCVTLPDLLGRFRLPVFRQARAATQWTRVPVSGMRRGAAMVQNVSLRNSLSDVLKKSGVITNLFTEQFTAASASAAVTPDVKLVNQPVVAAEKVLKQQGVVVNRAEYRPGQIVKPISFFRAPRPGSEVTLYEENGRVRYYTVTDAPSPKVSSMEDKVVDLQTQMKAQQELLVDTQRILREREEKIAELDNRLTEFKTSLQTTLVREARRPKATPHEWMVTGQVMDTAGEPVAGLRVRAVDRFGKLDVLLGEVETNEFGDYALVYHEREFAGLREELPELYLVVSDEAGTLLHSSQTPMRFKPGRADRLDVRLGEKPRT